MIKFQYWTWLTWAVTSELMAVTCANDARWVATYFFAASGFVFWLAAQTILPPEKQ